MIEAIAKGLTKKNAGLFIFLAVGFLFSFKYLDRVTPYSAVISIGITLLYLLIWNKRNTLTFDKNLSKKLTIAAIVIFTLASFFVFKKIPVETLKVDRWSVITSYWDNYFKGDYVYLAKSNMGNYPGPMPFYFILALPFYLMGELGFFSVLGAIAFYFLIEKTITDHRLKLTAVVLILANIAYLWEVACRSNVFLNGTLVLAVLVYFINQKAFGLKTSIGLGILIGLVLSTRNVFVIPFIIAFVYSLKKKRISFKQTFLIGTVALISFCLTFLPFIWNHFAEFKTMNPFIIQSTVLVPFQYTAVFIIASFIAGLYCKADNKVYFYSAFVLFMSIVVYFVYWITELGFHQAIINSIADISYFILCMPFALFYLLKENDN